MHYFTIRDVENLSGIKAHTLRIWEQRHGLRICKRKESLHRYYDNEDLKFILRIAHLYHKGQRISRLAALSADEINQLTIESFKSGEYDVLINQLIDAGLEYNALQFEQSLRTAVKSMGLEKCIQNVIYPFLDKIGLLWMTNHVLPGHEHFCGHLLQKLLLSSINELPPVKSTKPYCVLLFTPPNEMHYLPLLIAQYVLKKKAIRTVMLGSNIDADIISYCCDNMEITHLYFHFITNLTGFNTSDYIDMLASRFANKRIIAGGGALKEMVHAPSNVHITRSAQEITALHLLLDK
ncbi:MAG: MerR family transcriptional regulator [Chitinophagaceae bacterium]